MLNLSYARQTQNTKRPRSKLLAITISDLESKILTSPMSYLNDIIKPSSGTSTLLLHQVSKPSLSHIPEGSLVLLVQLSTKKRLALPFYSSFTASSWHLIPTTTTMSMVPHQELRSQIHHHQHHIFNNNIHLHPHPPYHIIPMILLPCMKP